MFGPTNQLQLELDCPEHHVNRLLNPGICGDCKCCIQHTGFDGAFLGYLGDTWEIQVPYVCKLSDLGRLGRWCQVSDLRPSTAGLKRCWVVGLKSWLMVTGLEDAFGQMHFAGMEV